MYVINAISIVIKKIEQIKFKKKEKKKYKTNHDQLKFHDSKKN